MTIGRAAVLDRLMTFFHEQLAAADGRKGVELTPETSLKERGLLSSLGTARLVAFVRDAFGVDVPLRRMTGGDYRTPGDIADLVASVLADSAAS